MALRLTTTLALALSLTACSGGAPAPATDAEPSTAPAASPTSASTTGTAPGTELGFGDSAVLVWEPAQDVTGELELSVERVVEQRQSVLDGWTRDEAMAAARPYFVTVTLANVGDSDLGGQDVPLYLRDTNRSLGAPWTLGGEFSRCQSGPMPDPFPAGSDVEMCLVYLVPHGGRVRDLVFEPTEGYDPITWTGDVERPAAAKRAGKGVGTDRAQRRRG